MGANQQMLIGSGSAYSALVLSDGPYAYWQLNDASGASTAKDYSGNGFTLTKDTNATLGNPGIVTTGGTSANCPTFTSRNGFYVQASSLSYLQPPFSLEGWFNIASFASQQNLYSGGATSSTTISGLTFTVTTDGKLHCSNGLADAAATSAALPLASTFHVVWTTNGAAGGNLVYINGVSVSLSTNAALSYITSGTVYTTIGEYYNGSFVNPCSAKVGHVAVYNKILSGAQVLAHYNAGK